MLGPCGGVSCCLPPLLTSPMCGAPRTAALAPPQLWTDPWVLPTRPSSELGVLCSHRRGGRHPSCPLLIIGVSEVPMATSPHPQRWCCSGVLAGVPWGLLWGQPHSVVLAPSHHDMPPSSPAAPARERRDLEISAVVCHGGRSLLRGDRQTPRAAGAQPGWAAVVCGAGQPCWAVPGHAMLCHPSVCVPSARTRAAGGVGPPSEEGLVLRERSPGRCVQDLGMSPSQEDSWPHRPCLPRVAEGPLRPCSPPGAREKGSAPPHPGLCSPLPAGHPPPSSGSGVQPSPVPCCQPRPRSHRRPWCFRHKSANIRCGLGVLLLGIM